MYYPRIAKIPEGYTLVGDRSLVETREHLAMEHRVIHMKGEISHESDFAALLFAMDSVSQEPIKLIIDSPGGLLDTAFLYCDTFDLLRSPIYTLGRFCASAAVLILARGDKRYLLPHSKVMLHLPVGGGTGDSKDIKIITEQINLYQDKIVNLLQDCGVKKSSEEILEDIDRAFWLEPKDAIAYGLADEIMTKDVMADWLTNEKAK